MKRRHHQSIQNLVYPEIPTLSVMDINHDLEFLSQNQQILSTYDQHMTCWSSALGQPSPFSHRSGHSWVSAPHHLPTQSSSCESDLILQPHPLRYEPYPEVSYGGTS